MLVTNQGQNIFMWVYIIPIALFLLILILGLLYKLLHNHIGRTKKEKAVLIDRYTSAYRSINFHPPYKTSTDYILVFKCENKILKFKVSNWIYNAFHKNEKGLLIYKGSRLLEFKIDTRSKF